MVSNFACWVSVEQKQKEGVVACGHTLPALSLQTAQELGDLWETTDRDRTWLRVEVWKPYWCNSCCGENLLHALLHIAWHIVHIQGGLDRHFRRASSWAQVWEGHWVRASFCGLHGDSYWSILFKQKLNTAYMYGAGAIPALSLNSQPCPSRCPFQCGLSQWCFQLATGKGWTPYPSRYQFRIGKTIWLIWTAVCMGGRLCYHRLRPCLQRERDNLQGPRWECHHLQKVQSHMELCSPWACSGWSTIEFRLRNGGNVGEMVYSIPDWVVM